MANTVINTPELLNLDSTTGATILAKGTISERPTTNAIDGALRFNTDTNKTEYYDGTGWYEIVDEYASGFIGPATNYFNTKLYTGNGSTQSIGGYINGAGSFNGSSSRIDLGNNSSNNLSTISVSLWFKTSGNIGDYGTLINNGGANGGETGYYLGLNSNGTIKFEASTGIINGSTNYADNNWHQIVLTLNNGTYNIYVDGNQTPVLTGSGAFTSTATRPTWIGQFSYTVSALDFFNGLIDQVRIYNVALSASDVAALNLETAATATTAAFPSGQTAIATYTMDTSANGLLTTTDLSTVNYPAGAGCLALYEMNGNVNDTSGTYNGTPTNITYEGGAFDQAAVFNGSSSIISIPQPTLSGGFTLSAWFRTTSSAFQSIITMGGSSAAAGLNIFTNSGNVITSFGNGSSEDYNAPTSSVIVNTGAWFHVVLSTSGLSSGSTVKLYINGQLDDSETSSVSINTTSYTSAFSIGGRNLSGSLSTYFNGSIDQVRIFNTALTQAQVTTLARGIATSYSGTATNVNFNGHLDFAPDFTWIKARETADNNGLYDTVRGAGNLLESNTTSQATSYSTVLNSFLSNGFTVGSSSIVNVNNNDYVSWNWKGGGAAVTNNDGTTASQVSANKDSGFSIVKYTGAGDVNVGHGLLEAPNLIISKITNVGGDWVVYNSISGTGKYLVLNSTAFIATASEVFSAVTDTTFTHNWSGNSYSYIAYCWHSVAGYSKIGSYAGNGNATGPIVQTGFEPSWVMIKNTTTGTAWCIFDSARNPTNSRYNLLQAQDPAAELDLLTLYGLEGVDFLSTSFQLKDTNGSRNTLNNIYLYMAFA